MVAGLGLALGPVLCTTWLFLLGSFGRFSLEAALAGTIIIALAGVWVAWRRRHHDSGARLEDEGLKLPELRITLLMMMGIGLLAATWDTAFWPFLRYDTLWTFGYNAKIFMLEGHIPDWIDYYPLLVPLSYVFGSLAWGEFNDYAARAAVPWFLLASTFAAYLLGWRVYGKRIVGMITAALWLLVPASLVWASSGDLEHPMALYFTMAMVFFVLACRESQPDAAEQSTMRRYALIAGLMLGGAMWTKPTAGAFVFGVCLVLAGALLRAILRKDWAWFRAKFQVAVITGLATIPLGGMWYIRNLLLGHNWTNLPPAYWQDFAQRSGLQLGWVWFIAFLVAVMLVVRLWHIERQTWEMIGISAGVLLVAVAILPVGWDWRTGFVNQPQNITFAQWGMMTVGMTALVAGAYRHWNARWVYQLAAILLGIAFITIAIAPTALSIPHREWTWQTTWDAINGFREGYRRLTALEGMLIVVGAALLLWSGREAWREQAAKTRNGVLLTWGLGLPFFLVWFWSFSYHYRLVLTVMPVIWATIAALLAGGILKLVKENWLRRAGLVIVVISVSLMAPFMAAYHTLFVNFSGAVEVTSDRDKYTYANPALMQVVGYLENYAADYPEKDEFSVLAPGENRLAFYFPEWHINDEDVPADIDDLKGYDLYVQFQDERFWQLNNLLPNQVQTWTELAWVYPLPDEGEGVALDGPDGRPFERVLRPITVRVDDGNNAYEIFEVKWSAVYQPVEPEILLEVIYGGTIELVGIDLPVNAFQPGETFLLKAYWRGTENGPPFADYTIYVHLLDPATGALLSQRDGGLMGGIFPTRFLTPGLVLQDRREWQFPPDVRSGPAILRIGVYEPPQGPRLSAEQNGEMIGDGISIRVMVGRNWLGG